MTLTPVCGFTVEDVMKVMMENGCDRYTFTDEGEGCRFWICTVVGDLERAGKIPKESVVLAVHTLGSYWAFPSTSTPREMEAGTFF